jgi:outer membrane protein assembly factor BamD (BamD/ComL family)
MVVIFAYSFLGTGCTAWHSFRERQESLVQKIFNDGWNDPEADKKLAEAEQDFEAGRYHHAIKLFKRVADNTNNDMELREKARFLQAESRRLAGQYPQAVDTYHKYLIDHPTGLHRREACAKMYEIANYWLDDFRQEIEKRSGEKGILHWHPSWPNPWDRTKPMMDQEGRALEALEHLHTQDVTGPTADRALFWCGYVNFVRGNFQESDHFFSQLVELHKDSPLRPQALAYAIQAKNNSTGGAIYDGRKCAEALQLVQVAEATVPELTQNPEMADKLTRAKFAIRSQQAEKDFRTAEYYERVGHPGSAVFCYELVRRRYPGTRYAEMATVRKDNLLARAQQGRPELGNDPFALVKGKWKEVFAKQPPSDVSPLINPPPSVPVPGNGVMPASGTNNAPGGR